MRSYRDSVQCPWFYLFFKIYFLSPHKRLNPRQQDASQHYMLSWNIKHWSMHTIYLFIYHPFFPFFIPSFICLFIYLFIHPFTHLFNKYTYYIHWKLYPLYLHYFTRWVWGRDGACTELHTLYTILSSHDLKFSFVCFLVLCFCLCVYVCLFVWFACFFCFVFLSFWVNK